MTTKGILLAAWGKRGYIYAAYNLAFSIKHFNRRLPVYLYCDPQILSELVGDQADIFDEIIPIPYEILQRDPAGIKITAYDNLPFDYTLFLDVDAIALQDLEPCIDELIQTGKYFFSHILDTHTLDKGDNIPNMVWSTANKIWEKYQLPKDAVLPCTNSSFQFIKKCPESAELFERVRKNMANAIPLNELKTQWGASQPDELYLNIAMAQMGITGKTDKQYLFMGNANSPDPLHKLQEKHFILSIFGGKRFTRPRYTEWYDKLNIQYHHKNAKTAHFKYAVIARDKHANTKPIKFQGVSRFQKAAEEAANTAFIEGKSGEKVILFSAWYKAKTESRQKEIDQALINNLNNPEIERVVIVGEDDCYITHEKLSSYKTSSRPTYDSFIEAINQQADDQTISIFCNGDIYLDAPNIRKLRGINFTDTCLALSRWEMDVNERPRLFSYEWSQDTWVFRGKISGVSCSSYLGIMQCDNRFAYECSKRYRIINPCKDIQTFHLHTTGERTYDVYAKQEGELLAVKPCRANEYLKKRLLIIQPGKVGDILICAPIALHFSDEYFIDWHCPKKYHDLFDSLPYAKPVDGYNEKNYNKVIDLSFGLGGQPEKWWQQNKTRFDSFVQAKYELAGLPYHLKNTLIWKRNTLKENALYELLKKDHKFSYILVHDSSDYGTAIQVEGKHIIKFKPVDGYTIFDWYKVIMRADEVHCIDSSLCNFVDMLPEVKAKLFYYKTDKVPNKWDETLLNKEWQRIQAHQMA